LKKHSVLFSRKLGKLLCKPVHLELTDPNAKPYHGKPYQVPHSLLPLLKKEVERLCEIEVLHKTNNLEWAAQGFAVPKKNKQIQFVTDFRMLNRFLCRYPFPLPSIQEIMHTVDGLTFVSILDLIMGFWTILLNKESQHYKQQHKNYGHLPTKVQRDIEPRNQVHVNLIGPWMIPQ
jgi:hypothetical protein